MPFSGIGRVAEPIGHLRNGGRAAPISVANAAPRCEARSKRTRRRCRAPATHFSLTILWRPLCKFHGGAPGSGELSQEGRDRQRAAVTKYGLYAGPNNPVIDDPRAGPAWPGHRPKLAPEERKAYKFFRVPLRRYRSRRLLARDPRTGRFTRDNVLSG